MSVVFAANDAAAEPSARPQDAAAPAYEHLHLHLVRTHWATRRHDNLGAGLQDALDVLDREGWEVVTAFVDPAHSMPEIILRRRRSA